jgi:hypothetical protein
VCARLNAKKISVMTLERPEYPSFGSLAEVKRILIGCAGVVILGFRDLEIKEGCWREGTKEEAPVSGRYLATEVDADRGGHGHHGWTASAGCF